MQGTPEGLVEQLTGLPPDEIAKACTVADLEAARLLIDDALGLKHTGPVLRLVSQAAGG